MVQVSKRVVFYSWQSDLPNRTNRSLIEAALDRATKNLAKDGAPGIEATVESDTRGVSGSPDIGKTIFEKIERCDVFVCDVSIVSGAHSGRTTPNPNVLVEVGYALKALGAEHVLMVMNTAHGGPETLPFDLKMKRAIVYEAREDESDLAQTRGELAKKLERGIRAVLDRIPNASGFSDDRLVLQALAEKRPEPGHPDPWQCALSGIDLAIRTGLPTARIGDSVEILVGRSAVEIRPFGPAEKRGMPFDFSRARITAVGKRLLEESGADVTMPGPLLPPAEYVDLNYLEKPEVVWPEQARGFRVAWEDEALLPTRVREGILPFTAQVSGREVRLCARGSGGDLGAIRTPLRSPTEADAARMLREQVDPLANLELSGGRLVVNIPRPLPASAPGGPPMGITYETIATGSTLFEVLAGAKVRIPQ
jgi:hypothetical protein